MDTPTSFTSLCHPAKSGWRPGPSVLSDSFDDLSAWRAEGNLSASSKDGRLLIECGDAKEDRGNVWSVNEFESPFYIQFRFRKLSGRSGLNLIFWNAQTLDGAEFFSVPRDWDMNHVTDGNMASYHISYCRGGSGITNFHKNPGFHDLVQDVPDPLADPGTDWHTIGIYQNGGHLMFFEDGRLVHDIDEAADFPLGRCLQTGPHRTWPSCPGLSAVKVYDPSSTVRDLGGKGRPYTYAPALDASRLCRRGRIGFRHQNGVTLYDDFVVWSLLPPG